MTQGAYGSIEGHLTTAGVSWAGVMRIRSCCDRVRHRHGWSLEAFGHMPGAAGSGHPVVRVRARVIDSNDPHPATALPIQITHTMPIPLHLLDAGVSDEDIFEWLWRCVEAVERHEAREFFWVDGKRWRDPHRDDNQHLYE